MRKSCKIKEQESWTQKKIVTFDTPDQGLIEVESKHSEQKNLSGESDTDGSRDADEQNQVDKVLSGGFWWM